MYLLLWFTHIYVHISIRQQIRVSEFVLHIGRGTPANLGFLICATLRLEALFEEPLAGYSAIQGLYWAMPRKKRPELAYSRLRKVRTWMAVPLNLDVG